MKFQFIRGKHDAGGILLYARSEENTRWKVSVKGFEPYLYVSEGEPCNDYRIKKVEGGYKGIYGEELKKIILYPPATIKQLRTNVTKSWEGDLDVVQRFLIDRGIKSGFEIKEVPSSRNNRNLAIAVKKIRSVNFALPPVVCYLNVEVYTEGGGLPVVDSAEHPVVAVSLGTNLHEEVITFLLSNDEHKRGGNVRAFKKETTLLQAVHTYLEELQPDIITGWRLREFDLQYLVNRAKKLSLEFDHTFALVFDMQRGWQKLERGSRVFLKDIAMRLNLTDGESIPLKRYRTQLYKENVDTLLHYSQGFIRYLKEIDKKRRITGFFWDLKNRVGLTDMESAFSNGNVINLLLLRELKDTVVLPSTPSKKERKKRERLEEDFPLEGGKIFTPDAGLYENIAVIDFSRFYPSVLIAKNISPELQEGITVYNDGTGVMTNITRMLWRERDHYEQKLEAVPVGSEEYSVAKKKRDIVKYLLNTTWAYMGWNRARIWNIKARKRVQEKAREALEYIAKESENMGYPVVYGDTDSIFVKTDSLDEAKRLKAKLNIKALNIDLEGRVTLDLDKFFRELMLVPHKTKRRAAKKRYIGRVTFKKWGRSRYH